MVEMYHYQSMWDVRTYAPLYGAFCEVFGTHRLWVTIDRVNFKKPVLDGAPVTNFSPHWDVNVNERPRPFAVQGLVALTDADEKMGGFRCVPELYRKMDEWMRTLPTGKVRFNYFDVKDNFAYDPEDLDVGRKPLESLKQWPIVQVPLKAGDLLIWDSFLLHSNGVNRGTRPRMAQYVSMVRAEDCMSSLAKEQVACWADSKPPSGWAFGGDPRKIEQNRNVRASLPPISARLLGLTNWED
jgi:ectoine hydroxylase-related dioxygenase (phytanoyl-CoA dioxygenase family)